MKQKVLHKKEDYAEELKRVVIDDSLEKAPYESKPENPRKLKKYNAYMERLRVQKEFVDYAICRTLNMELQRQKAQGGFCKPSLNTITIEVKFPLIFPNNEAVLRETMEYIEERNLYMMVKYVSGERATYILEGNFIESEVEA